MAMALVLATVAPEIGGVLIRGEKGTAKSTAVRALADVLPPIDVIDGDRFSIDPHDVSATSPDVAALVGPKIVTRGVRLVELPVGATEDRVLGSVHLESALSEGRVEYEPGLLAKAHRGLLYVDEVNLLHDHLVDLLLDAAAMGRSTVERDGVSIEHAARFVLVGTMNPEEGELRPQLLDRFGLTVEVAAPRDPASRAEVVRRRMAFDADPIGFGNRYAAAQDSLTAGIIAARARVAQVLLPEAALLKIAEVCAAFEVEGLRADIVTARAAIAHAAWLGQESVTRADIRAAARLTLPHRRRRKPFDAPGLDEDLLDRILGDSDLDPDPEPEPDSETDPSTDPEPDPELQSPGGDTGDSPDQDQVNNDAGESADSVPEPQPEPNHKPDQTDRVGEPQPVGSQAGTSVVASAPSYRTRLFTVRDTGDGDPGKRSRARTRSGRRVGAVAPDSAGGALHLLGTILAAAPHQSGGRLVLRPGDLRIATHEGRESNLVLFCVDASGSMAARKRMAEVKGAVVSLLLDAYRRRDKVGLIAFRDTGAVLELPPTRSVDIAAARLDGLPAGGRTPLAEGLLEAGRVLARERVRDRRCRPLLVVVTDGRATAGADAVQRSRQAAGLLAEAGVAAVVVDCETGPMRLGLAVELAAHLGAEYLRVDGVSAEELSRTVRERVA
jgi:magnesium chelatase subunit D